MYLQTLSEKVKQKFGDAVALQEGEPASGIIYVDIKAIRDVAVFCKDDPELDMQALSCLSGVDFKDRIEIVYHLTSYHRKHSMVLKVRLDREKPEIPSLESVWKTANWHERECFDLLGVVFTGHPDLRRILLPDDWVGYPLRKDYKPPVEYHGMSHSRENPLFPDEGKKGADDKK